MTLKEVMEMIPAANPKMRVPNVMRLTEEASPILCDDLDEETSATIFDNGYVLYQSGANATVFPLHVCRDYTYNTADGNYIVPFSAFADQPWQIRIFIAGKDRLTHNKNNYQEKQTVSYDAYETSSMWSELSDKGAGDPLRILEERDSRCEEIKALYKNLEGLTDHQREILTLCVVQGKTREEVAKEMGLTHQAVTDCLMKALRRLRRSYGINEKNGERNHFSRKG